MFCKIFFIDDKNDLETLVKKIQVEESQIITNSFEIYRLTLENQLDSKYLRDLFPEEGKITYDIYTTAKKIQNQYREIFKNITFEELKIFEGIENQVLDEIILLEKARVILQEKKNTIFVFEGFSFTYFSITKIAYELGYEEQISLHYYAKKNIHEIHPLKHGLYNFKNKIKFLKQHSSIIKLFSKVNFKTVKQTWKDRNKNIKLRKSIPSFLLDKIKIIKNMILADPLTAILRFYINYFLFVYIKRIIGIDPTKKILKNMNNDINKTYVKYRAKVAFFFTTNQEDLYLKSLYPVIDKFEDEKTLFQIFSIDLVTKKVLLNKEITFIDCFQNVNLLAKAVMNLPNVKKVIKEIIDISQKSNITILYNYEMSNHFKNEIYRTVAIMMIFEYVIKKMNLKSIAIANDGSMFGNCIIEIAKKYKIPSFFIPSAHINPNPLHADWFKSDKICIYGTQGVKVLTKLGYDQNKLLLTGSPKYDYIAKMNPNESKSTLEKKFGIDSTKKLIVIGMARWHKNDEIWMSDFIKFCNKNNFEIIIKIHPLYKEILQEENSEKIKLIKKNCKNYKYLCSYNIDLKIILSAADLVITEYSNVGAEAILMNKPLMIVNFIKEKLANQDFEIFLDAAIYFEDYNDMTNTVLEVLNTNKFESKFKEGQKKVKDMWNIYNDGKASQRVFDALVSIKPEQTRY